MVVLAKLSYLPLFCQKCDCVEKLPLQLLHVVSLRLNSSHSETLHMCNINRGTALARMFIDPKATDGTTVLHRTVLEALDRNLQDIRQCDLNLGGFPTLLSEDFRQIPVIHQRTRADIVHSSIKSSTICCHI